MNVPLGKTPRLVPQRPFPTYAYVPGCHPRPTSNAVVDIATAADFGVDLFNHGYYWEAHEQWEALWRVHGRDSLAGQMAYGLIALAAAGVKAREGNADGLLRHAQRAEGIFAPVLVASPTMFDLPVAALIGFAQWIARNGVCRPAVLGAPPEVVLGTLPVSALLEKAGQPGPEG